MPFSKTNRFVLLGVFTLCNGIQTLIAQPADKKISAVQIEGEIVIDGDLNEPQWNQPQPATDFIQNDPAMGEPSTERTEVRILYDEEYLYLGVYCFDSAGKEGLVLTDVTRDPSAAESDHFSVVFDTFDDNRNGFIFGTNPGGAKRDGQVRGDGSDTNFDWDAVWEVKTKITESGWQIEMAIPFTTLRFQEREPQLWGVNFSRRIRRKNEFSLWTAVPRPHVLSTVSFAGTLEGFEQIHQGRNLYFKPYLSAPVLRRRGDDLDFVPEVGLDVKYGLTPGLTLDLTVNTDFAQVEADEQQINLTRFSLFFPEKRDFFLENSGIFQFGKSQRRFGRASALDLIPFFSRRIGISQGQLVPILGGARLSGRADDYTLGILSIQTDNFKDTPTTNFTVVRLRRDLLRNSDFGGIFVNKQEHDGPSNRTFGVDANLRFFDYLDLVPFALKTDSPDRPGNDMATNISVRWRDRFWDLLAEHLNIGENFNPEVGFVPRTGIRKTRGRFSLRPRPEQIAWIRQLEPAVEANYIEDQEGILETRTVESSLAISFEDNSDLSFGYQASFERLDEPFRLRPEQEIPVGDYPFQEFSVSFSSNQSRLLSGSAAVQTGSFYDGNKDSYSLGLRFQPNYHFTAEVSWDHDDISLPSGDFTTNLVNTRLLYAFNTRTFLNALIQYNSTVGEIESNIRFNFIHRPLSDVFLVYNEVRDTTGEVQERAFIAKVTYALGL
jgi:hypothetical protein